MLTEQSVQWLYEAVARKHGITVQEVKRRAVAGDRLIAEFDEDRL